MSLSFTTMQLILHEIQRVLLGQKVRDLISLNPREFLLIFSDSTLLLSFQEPFLRFHLAFLKIPSTTTPFTNSIINKIHGMDVDAISLQNNDRILQILLKDKDL